MEDEIKERLLHRTKQMLEATVDEVMTRNVVTCDAADPAAKAARVCLDNGFLGLLVMKEGKPYNMVTVFDLLRLSYEEVFDPERDFLKSTIEDIIEGKKFHTVTTGTKLRETLNLMIEQKLRTVAVVNDGVVKGIVSYVDMVQWYRKTHEEVKTGKLQG